MISPKSIPENARLALRRHLDGEFSGMTQDRMSWWTHWAQIAEMFFPRRFKWFINPNQWNRGSQMNTQIVDETGVLAARILASGMMSGMTSPTRLWFKLGLHDLGEIPYGPVKTWLAECERRMMRVLQESNFYTSIGQFYHDLGVFSSATMLEYEDAEQVVRFHNPCLGEFFMASGPRQSIETFSREFTLTIKQVVTQFGLDNVSDQVAGMYKSGGAQLSNEIVIRHLIEPNVQLYDAETPLSYAVPPSFAYREVYWERDTQGDSLLQLAGYLEKCFVGGRWAVTGNDSYGSEGPGMQALPAVRQLQIEQRRKAEAIDKMVRPPMVASISMKNEPASILPGAVNYVADISGAGFKPAYLVDPRLAELTADVAEVQGRVKSIFFVDLFMMISELDTVRTATEIDARREEKLIQLGPVIERFENEVLDPIIDRTFAIMARRGLLPEAPPEISGLELNVQYVSMLAEAQRAAATTGIERMLQLAGGLAAVDPSVLDNIDLDRTVGNYANDLGVDPELIRTDKTVTMIRAARAKAEQKQAALEQTPAAVDAAKTLSETQLGGGQTALSAMMNG